jgi:hypothetical protein
VQCSEAAESVMTTQAHLHQAMSKVVDHSRDLTANTHEQTRATRALNTMVADLKTISANLMGMTQS